MSLVKRHDCRVLRELGLLLILIREWNGLAVSLALSER